MNFLGKIEDLINRALLWLGHKFMWLLGKLCPPILKRARDKIVAAWAWMIAWIKALPKNFKEKALQSKNLIKVDYKGVFAQALDAGQKAFEEYKQHSPLKAFLHALGAPFVFLYQWAASLKPAHFVVLFIFTVGSVFSMLGIFYNSKKIFESEHAARAPASEPLDSYSRPDYYKKDQRELSFNNVKIPVYVQGVNELRALIVDISVITSNRATRRWLETHEFEMRDHLVLTLEPVIPTFPMTEEGRTMITDKLRDELNLFLQHHQIEGEVKEARLVHILAH